MELEQKATLRFFSSFEKKKRILLLKQFWGKFDKQIELSGKLYAAFGTETKILINSHLTMNKTSFPTCGSLK